MTLSDSEAVQGKQSPCVSTILTSLWNKAQTHESSEEASTCIFRNIKHQRTLWKQRMARQSHIESSTKMVQPGYVYLSRLNIPTQDAVYSLAAYVLGDTAFGCWALHAVDRNERKHAYCICKANKQQTQEYSLNRAPNAHSWARFPPGRCKDHYCLRNEMETWLETSCLGCMSVIPIINHPNWIAYLYIWLSLHYLGAI